MNNKGFLEISFQWMFAILVGIVILVLTIYGITKLLGTEQQTLNLQGSKELGVLTNPLETSFEGSLASSINFPVNTRVYNLCDDFGDFGTQGIKISQESFGKWTDQSSSVDFESKYFFSEYPVEGKNMVLFSKPFEFPFKVANLIYIIPSNKVYCFQDAPDDIKEEIGNLKISNIITEDCSEPDTKICFGTEKCEINVNYNQEYVIKGEDKVYFKGNALMYAGIFSDSQVYECQLIRLMKRLSTLSQIYTEKANFIANIGCNTNLNSGLQVLNNLAQGVKSSSDLNMINTQAEELGMANSQNSMCNLW